MQYYSDSLSGPTKLTSKVVYQSVIFGLIPNSITIFYADIYFILSDYAENSFSKKKKKKDYAENWENLKHFNVNYYLPFIY